MNYTSIKIFDSHLHIIDEKFPLIRNNGYLPEKFDSNDYMYRMKNYKLMGGAIVSGSFQGFDQKYLINSISILGSNFVGVTQIPHSTTDQEIIELDKLGIRALRFNFKRGGSEDAIHLDRLARRVYDLVGWHTEFYIDSPDLEGIINVISKLPKISIDHLGLSFTGYNNLIKLVEGGAKIKATGFGRVNLNVVESLRLINSINPDALMFGTDLPSTRAYRPYEDKDVQIAMNSIGLSCVDKVFYSNAYNFYHKNSTQQTDASDGLTPAADL